LASRRRLEDDDDRGTVAPDPTTAAVHADIAYAPLRSLSLLLVKDPRPERGGAARYSYVFPPGFLAPR
jgi:hypothetical protein